MGFDIFLRKGPKTVSLFSKGAIFLTALCLSILTAEIALRNEAIAAKIEAPRIFLRGDHTSEVFMVDPLLGFRPVLNNEFYNSYGTKVNSYAIEKRPGIRRVLFIGDSVTARGRILNALKGLYGEKQFEYWNAGVESFNTVQELEFYKRYNFRIRPDACVLFFHINDFGDNPAAFWNKPNELIIYTSNASVRVRPAWLFERSRLFRCLSFRFLEMINRPHGSARVQAVRKALQEFKEIFENQEIDFLVVVLPLVEDPDKWRPGQKKSRTDILKILKDLKVRYIDLFSVLNEASSDYTAFQESPGDVLHPNDAFAKKMAEHLYANRLFEDSFGPENLSVPSQG